MSNVPKSKRSISELEFYRTAIRMRNHVTMWLLRDFGLKPRARDTENFMKRYGMTEEDSSIMSALMDKYGIGDRIAEKFPDWWVRERRRAIDAILTSMIGEIRIANSIFPTSIEEYHERRIHQDRAIGYLDALGDELNFVYSVITRTAEVSISASMPFVDMIELERKLLKGWRHSDNKILQRLRKGK